VLDEEVHARLPPLGHDQRYQDCGVSWGSDHVYKSNSECLRR
jgi:hypothetical protein